MVDWPVQVLTDELNQLVHLPEIRCHLLDIGGVGLPI